MTGQNANDKMLKWIDGISNMSNDIETYTRRDNAVTTLMKVCTDYDDVDLDICSARDIECAIEYIKLGMNCKDAFNFAVNYGMTGIKIIQDLSRTFGFMIK